jgi:hypothetical protein
VWISTAGIGRRKKSPLFRSMGKADRLGDKAMSRFDVLHMIKRRAEGRRPTLFHLLSHVSSHRHYDLSAKRRRPGACPDYRQSRIATHDQTL